MFRPSESANDLFRRLNNRAFELRVKPDKIEHVMFGSTVEVLSNPADISEFVLGTAVSFATQFEDGVVVHVSIAGNLTNSLRQSQVNLTSTSLYRMHGDGRVKAVVATSLLHLIAVFELFKITLNGEKVLLVLEGLSSLFLAHKANEACQVRDASIASALRSLQSLVDSQFVIALWVNSVPTSKQYASLRDGPVPSRDFLNTLWKQSVPRFHYTTTGATGT